jgi:hypothetical protein
MAEREAHRWNKLNRGYRAGYPPLFNGSSIGTKLLVEIAAAEPVTIKDLPESSLHPPANVTRHIHKLVAAGRIRPYLSDPRRHTASRWNPKQYCIDRRSPIYHETVNVLRAIGTAHGIQCPDRQVESLTGLAVDTVVCNSLSEIFGPRQRTIVIVLSALVADADATTIARMVGVSPMGNSKVLLDPLVRDSILDRLDAGMFRLYRLNRAAPWSQPLLTLIRRVVELEPTLSSLSQAAEILRASGDSVPRKYMRRLLESGKAGRINGGHQRIIR